MDSVIWIKRPFIDMIFYYIINYINQCSNLTEWPTLNLDYVIVNVQVGWHFMADHDNDYQPRKSIQWATLSYLKHLSQTICVHFKVTRSQGVNMFCSRTVDGALKVIYNLCKAHIITLPTTTYVVLKQLKTKQKQTALTMKWQ